MSSRALLRRTIGFLNTRKRAYQLWFNSPPGKEVLADLAVFCRAAETCAVPGDRDRTMMLIGRNEVWLRIAQHMHMTGEQLFVLYDAQTAARIAAGNDDDE